MPTEPLALTLNDPSTLLKYLRQPVNLTHQRKRENGKIMTNMRKVSIMYYERFIKQMHLWDGEEVIDRADAKWLTPQMQRMWRAKIHLEVLVLYEPTKLTA